MDDIIITPGHVIAVDPGNPDTWIGPFDYRGQADLILEHIRVGVETAAATGAVWMPSGGDTSAKTALSEGASYRDIAIANEWWGCTEVATRTYPEVHARCSLGNCVLPIALFKAVTGHYPSRVTVAGFRFKQARFNRHAAALGLPAGRFTYIPVNDPPAEILPQAIVGETKKFEALLEDPYLKGETYRIQRAARNPRRIPLPRYGTELDRFIEFLYGDDLYAPEYSLKALKND